MYIELNITMWWHVSLQKNSFSLTDLPLEQKHVSILECKHPHLISGTNVDLTVPNTGPTPPWPQHTTLTSTHHLDLSMCACDDDSYLFLNEENPWLDGRCDLLLCAQICCLITGICDTPLNWFSDAYDCHHIIVSSWTIWWNENKISCHTVSSIVHTFKNFTCNCGWTVCQ